MGPRNGPEDRAPIFDLKTPPTACGLAPPAHSIDPLGVQKFVLPVDRRQKGGDLGAALGAGAVVILAAERALSGSRPSAYDLAPGTVTLRLSRLQKACTLRRDQRALL